LAVWQRRMAAASARSVADRLEEWAAICRATADMHADAIRRRHPAYSERHVFLALVRARYGDELYAAAWPGEPFLDA